MIILNCYQSYHHKSFEFESHSRLGVLDTTLCDKVCQWLGPCRLFFPGHPVSSTNKTDRCNISEILLNVALNTITLFLTLLLCVELKILNFWRIDFLIKWKTEVRKEKKILVFLHEITIDALNVLPIDDDWGHRAHDRILVGFTTIYVISAHGELYSIPHYVIKFVNDLRHIGGFHRFPPPIATI